MTDVSPEARRLLGLARRGDDLREIDRVRLTQRIAQRLTLAAGAAGMTLVSAKAASGAGLTLLLGKGAAVGVLITATTIGVWKAGEHLGASHFSAKPTSAALANESSRRQVTTRERAPLSAAKSEPEPSEGADSDERAPLGVAKNEPEPSESASKGDAPRNNVVAASPKPKQNSGNPAALTSSPSTATSGLDAASRPGARDPLEDEVMAFRTVQQSMTAGDARRALTLISEQNRHFAAGALQQERAAARVFALCTLGRNAEARSEARAFEERWSRSPMLARVRRACDAEVPK